MNLPPLHPSIVHFPIALIVLSVVAEAIGYFGRNEKARTVAWWALAGAALSGPVTILAGYTDMWRASLAPGVHELVHTHLKLGWVLVVAIASLAIWRWVIRRDATRSPGGGYLSAALLVFALTLFQGWYGGEMAYAHGAGVAAAGQGMHPKAEAQERLTPVAEVLRKLPFIGAEKGHHEGGHQHGVTAGHAENQSEAQPQHAGEENEDHHHAETPPSPAP